MAPLGLRHPHTWSVGQSLRGRPSLALVVLLVAIAVLRAPQATGGAADGDAPGWLGPAGHRLHFSDATFELGLSFKHATPWSEIDYSPAMSAARMIGGAGVGDFDRDGRQDLFVIGGGLGRDALFHARPDGTFVDIAASAGLLGEPHLGAGVAVADYDADGWLDIYVTSHGPTHAPGPGHHRLYRNQGDLTFQEVAREAGVHRTSRRVADGYGAVFADFDLDGDLDLFVAGWEEGSRGNRLFRNQGDGTFVDVTRRVGIVDDGIRGFSPCLLDTDGDRYPELMLVADFGTSRYWENRRGRRFIDRTRSSGAGLEWSGMGTAMADLDGDGRIDWYSTAIFDAEDAGRGDGSKLYLNRGGHTWEEVAGAAGVDDGGWGWGAVAVDLDLDGRLDLVATNGWNFEAYREDTTRVWMATGDVRFEDAAMASGLVHDLHGLGVVAFDLDADGDRDIAVTAPNDELHVYRNELQPGSAWLRVFLDTRDTDLPPDGIGSHVVVRSGGREQHRWIGGCSEYLTTSELSAHFGLGDAEVVDEVLVEWTDGTSTRVTDVVPRQTLSLRPGGVG